jgi:hypothetical protein
MKLNLISTSTARLRTFFMCAMILIVSACGGGNGGPGAPLGEGEGGNTLQARIDFLPNSGIVPVNSALLIRAVVQDKFGNTIPNVLVTFSIPAGSQAGTLSPPEGLAKTDADGVASIFILHGTSGHSDEITATTDFIDSTGTAVTATNSTAFTSQ